ncbi:unnamed protein product, partial [Prunus brigantina]
WAAIAKNSAASSSKTWPRFCQISRFHTRPLQLKDPTATLLSPDCYVRQAPTFRPNLELSARPHLPTVLFRPCPAIKPGRLF